MNAQMNKLAGWCDEHPVKSVVLLDLMILGAFIACSTVRAGRSEKVANGKFKDVPSAKVISVGSDWRGVHRIFFDENGDGIADYSAAVPKKVSMDELATAKSGEEWLKVVNPRTMQAERE